jgi:hypothetical protein
MFRKIFPSIIRSSRLYTQHQVYVIQVSWLLASGQSNNLYDIYLMLCVQSWTPDDGCKDHPKHVEWYSANSKIVHLVGFSIEIYHNGRSHESQIVEVTLYHERSCNNTPTHILYTKCCQVTPSCTVCTWRQGIFFIFFSPEHCSCHGMPWQIFFLYYLFYAFVNNQSF